MLAKQRYYPLRDADNPYLVFPIPVSEEIHHAFSSEIERVKKYRKRHGLCNCPRSKWYLCDAFCECCPYSKWDCVMSLDATSKDEYGWTLDETIATNDLPLDEMMIEKDLYLALWEALRRLSLDEYTLVAPLMRISEREAATELGLPRSTYKYRLRKVLSKLRHMLE